MKLVSIFLLLSSMASAASPSWEGKFTGSNKDEGNPPISSGGIIVSKCAKDGCDFDFSNGNESGVCECEGRFTFSSGSKAVFQIDGLEKPKEKCRVAFKLEGDTLTVDSSGEVCKESCGMSGPVLFSGHFKRAVKAK